MLYKTVLQIITIIYAIGYTFGVCQDLFGDQKLTWSPFIMYSVALLLLHSAVKHVEQDDDDDYYDSNTDQNTN